MPAAWCHPRSLAGAFHAGRQGGVRRGEQLVGGQAGILLPFRHLPAALPPHTCTSLRRRVCSAAPGLRSAQAVQRAHGCTPGGKERSKADAMCSLCSMSGANLRAPCLEGGGVCQCVFCRAPPCCRAPLRLLSKLPAPRGAGGCRCGSHRALSSCRARLRPLLTSPPRPALPCAALRCWAQVGAHVVGQQQGPQGGAPRSAGRGLPAAEHPHRPSVSGRIFFGIFSESFSGVAAWLA